MDEYGVEQFWSIKNKLNIEDLYNYANEYYTQDFINNIAKWKQLLFAANQELKESLSNTFYFNEIFWEDMTYNYFCSEILEGIKIIIDKNNDIIPTDFEDIIFQMENKHYALMYNKMKEQKTSLANLINSIMKPFLI